MIQVIPETPPEFDSTRIIERPDGFHWQDVSEGREFGPFPTLLAAVMDMQYHDDGEIEPGETLEQVEADIGIADWIDSETGVPAEEGVPRVRDD